MYHEISIPLFGVFVALWCVVISLPLVHTVRLYPPDSEITADTLQSIVIVHRHGARLPAVYDPSTGTLNWGDCPLTNTGVAQLKKLGVLLRTEYERFLPGTYNPESVQSCFTDFTRTQRSGLAFLAGLFEDAPGLVSMQCSMELERSLRPWERFPAYVLHESFLAHSILAIMNDHVDPIVSVSDREAVDNYFSSDKLCTNKISLGLCMMLIYETVSKLRSENAPCPEVLCKTIVLKTAEYAMKLWNYHYLLNFPQQDFQKEFMPSLGGPLSKYIINFMKEDAENGVLVRHLSAHDDTLIILYQTLGLINENNMNFDDMMQPSYGEALIFESHKGGYFYVRRARLPEPTAIINEPKYYIFDLQLPLCSSTVCRFRDWLENVEINHKLPHGDDFCFASPIDHAREGCTVNQANPEASVKPKYPCVAYRKYCPQYACVANTIQSGYVLDKSQTPPVCVAVASTKSIPTAPSQLATTNSTSIAPPSTSRSGEVALMVCLIVSFCLFFVWFVYALLRHYRIITVSADDGSEYRQATNNFNLS